MSTRTPEDLGIVAQGIRQLRPLQERTLDWIAEHDEPFLLVNAPTGSGKSVIARAAAREMGAEVSVYLASDHALQDQFVKTFPDARPLKGRGNYFGPGGACDGCNYKHGSCGVCGNCEVDSDRGHMHSKINCLGCPYAIAKQEALAAPFAALNTAYFLAETSHVSEFSRKQLVVVDEADLLEGVLLDHVGVSIPPKRLDVLSFTYAIEDGLDAWAEDIMEEAETKAAVERAKADGTDDPRDVAHYTREAEYWEGLARRLAWMRKDLATDSLSWIRVDPEGEGIQLKPVFVRGYAKRLLWANGTRFLLLSATLLAPDVFAQELGIEPGEWASLDLPSSFPASNRPIRYRPAGSMAYRNRERSLTAVVSAMDAILDEHRGRVLVHSQTFGIARQVLELSRHRGRLLAYGSRGAASAIEDFVSPAGAGKALIGPSLKRGVDLPDDLCEAVIALVMPRADWGDERVRARAQAPGGSDWYDVHTVRELCQMTGRGVRHETDRCATYILDGEFGRFLGRRRRMFPRWWLDALVWEGSR